MSVEHHSKAQKHLGLMLLDNMHNYISPLLADHLIRLTCSETSVMHGSALTLFKLHALLRAAKYELANDWWHASTEELEIWIPLL